MNIHDVQQLYLKVHEDDRGYLYEVVHASDSFVPQFGQAYIVGDRVEYITRAYHKHHELHDWFCIVHGSAKFVLVDDREDSPTYRKFDILVGTNRTPSVIVVPPGVYHGWMSLEPDTLLCSAASHEYNRDKPDEVRVPPTEFDELIGYSPWQVIAK